MKNLSMLLLLTVTINGCFAQTEQPAPAPACPVVVCGWVDDPDTLIQSCPAPFLHGSSKHFESLDDGTSACWFYEETCRSPTWGPTTAPTAECPAQECKRTHVDCQPAGDARIGRP